MIPLLINNKHLCEIFAPTETAGISTWTDDEINAFSLAHQMYPTSVDLISETYSKDTERTADYELENLVEVNRKAKPAFTWDLIKADYVKALLEYLGYNYNFKDQNGVIIPREAATIAITYWDFIGIRTIQSYLGQTIEGQLVEYNGALYISGFRLAFPER